MGLVLSGTIKGIAQQEKTSHSYRALCFPEQPNQWLLQKFQPPTKYGNTYGSTSEQFWNCFHMVTYKSEKRH